MKTLELGSETLAFVGCYLMVMIGLGLLGRARSREASLADFYLGGSSFGVVVLFLTFFATQYSGNTLLGFAGRAYQRGASYIVSVTFMILAITILVAYAPRLYRLSRRFGYITPADFVFHRFRSHGLRVLTVLLLSWGLANYILEQLVAMGRGVEAMAGGKLTAVIVALCRKVGLSSMVAEVAPGELDFMGGVLILVLVMLVYESLGGMRAVAWTDVIQGGLLFAGCGCILYILLGTEGGLAAATETISRATPEKLRLPDAAGLRSWVSTLVLLSFGVAFYPHAIQRVFAARDQAVLRRSLGLMAFMPLVTTLLAFLLGYIGSARFPGLGQSESDKITVLVLTGMGDSLFIKWLVIVVLTAVLAAIMSTADSALLSVASMFTKDIYKAYLRPDATPAQCLRVGKRFGWFLMCLLVLSAYASLKTQSSIWLLIKLKLEFMVQISPAFLLGLFWRGLRPRAALAGMIAGTAVTLVIWAGSILGAWTTRSPLGFSAGVWGLTLNYAFCVIGSASARLTQTETDAPHLPPAADGPAAG
ncbi:MAG: sodium:solute symporter family protein [Myxococcales bacterium]|nr:sodium:solute symporter family protein [Myxococcales bacterium]MDD9964989.1 sodium:solute symporter family protein [Myxococcales bacterium]